jgi:hypothetical protein
MSGLFVSKEHKRQARLRTNRAYHCIVYVVLGVGLAQIPFGMLLLREMRTSSLHLARRASAEREQNRLAAAAAPLKALARKVEEAREWSLFSSQKTTVTEVLSNLEHAVNKDVCLTEITVRNRAEGPRDPDRLEVELQGFCRAHGAEAWQLALDKAFEGWSKSAPWVWRTSSLPAEGGIIPFSLLLKQLLKTEHRKDAP